MNAVMQQTLPARQPLVTFFGRQAHLACDVFGDLRNSCLTARRVSQHRQHQGLVVGDRHFRRSYMKCLRAVPGRHELGAASNSPFVSIASWVCTARRARLAATS
jgi:hypothetical protein